MEIQDKIELPDFSFQKEMMRQAVKIEDDVLKQVLSEFLGRDATIEDAKECQQVMKSGNYEKYILVYKNEKLDSITKSFEGNNFIVAFRPNDFLL